jgi:hypothetical protein
MLRARRCVSLGLVLGLAGALVCPAQQREDRKSADIQVWSIRATTKNKDISPELRDIADKLKKQFKFTGFKLEKTSTGQAAIGKTFTASLIGGYTASVTPKKSEDKRITLEVEVRKGKDRKLNATVTVSAGTFQLFGGLALDGGDQLIVAVSAK